MKLISGLATFKHTVEVGKAISISFVMAYLFASDFQQRLQGYGVEMPMLFIILIGVIGTWFIGYLIIRSGLYSEEQAFAWRNNKEWMKSREGG